MGGGYMKTTKKEKKEERREGNRKKHGKNVELCPDPWPVSAYFSITEQLCQ
jgi:hypothetical protein